MCMYWITTNAFPTVKKALGAVGGVEIAVK